MTVTIDTITLDNDPILEGLSSRQDVYATRYEAIDGTEVVVERARVAGYPLTLKMTLTTGWLKKSTIDSIRAIAVVGAEVDLVYQGTTYRVRFRHEESGGAIVVSPADERWTPQDSDCLMIGEIRLMTVG